MKRACLLIAAAILAVASVASATTALKLSFKELVSRSDVIVLGSVVDVHPIERDGKVLTSTTIAVEEAMKGTPSDRVEIIHLGGRTEKKVTRVAGMPSFQVGERVLVFLEQPDGFSHFVVTGLGQGKFLIATPATDFPSVVTQDNPDLSLVEPVETPQGVVMQPAAAAPFKPVVLETFRAAIVSEVAR